MSNIYLKATIEEKNWHRQNFNFLGLKNLSPCQFWGAPTHANIIEFKTFCCNLKIRGLGAKVCELSITLFLKGIICFEVKESMHFIEENYKL